VAEKIRPLPEQCAVGTYVILRHQPAVEALALTTLRALGFTYGIAEIEIAETGDGQLSVVEVNPRPWTQIELARCAGYDFLAFLLDLPTSSRPRPRQDGVGWIDFTSDLFACFSRSTGLVRHRRIGVGDYVRSLARARVFAGFAINDPYPALRELINVAATSLRHRI
jgi:predicted ATP-grasp superfamily ATP-dependent carboligase